MRNRFLLKVSYAGKSSFRRISIAQLICRENTNRTTNHSFRISGHLSVRLLLHGNHWVRFEMRFFWKIALQGIYDINPHYPNHRISSKAVLAVRQIYFVQIGWSVPLFYIDTFALFNFLINDGRLILLFQKSCSKKASRREKQEIIILAIELIIAEFFTMIF